MTSCSECLTELRTVRLAEIRADSPVALHYATCQNCRGVAEDLFFAESRLATALADAGAYSPPGILAGRVLEGSELRRRKRIGVWLRRGLLLIGAGLIPLALEAVLEDDTPPSRTITETLTLKCVSPGQARELATGYLRSDGAAIYVSEDLRTITLRGVPDEVISAQMQIERLDAADACGVTPAIAGEATTAPERK